jgi:hypothetical protein
MSDYIKTVDFASKDTLTTGNPLKVVKGTEINTELVNIAAASATKVESNNGVHTGTTSMTNVTVAGTLTAGTIDGGTY